MAKELVLEKRQTLTTKTHELVVINDDYNTFDWVIKCLVEICDHNPVQAEQCAYIVHHKGCCTVKKGIKEQLIEQKRSLNTCGLTAEVV